MECKPEGEFCQSCGMPLEAPADYGTEKDGAKSSKYCHHCYKAGEFTEPDMTLEGMTEKVIGIMKLMNIPEGQVRKLAGHFIPTLERWRN